MKPNQMNEYKKPNSFLIGMILGGVVGTALGVLYAPGKGAQTRKKLKEFTDEVKEKSEPVIKSVSHDLAPVVSEIKKAIGPLVSEATDQIKKTVRTEVDKVKKEVADTMSLADFNDSENTKTSSKKPSPKPPKRKFFKKSAK